MYPNILTIGPFTLHSFGLMLALGFFAAMLAMRGLAKGMQNRDDYLSRLLIWLMLGGIIGARLAYVAEHWSNEFAGRAWAIIRIDQGGLVFYGGVLGAIIAIFLFARRQRQSSLAVMDLAAAALPLGHAFGRVGCFLNGCCYGKISQSPIAVRFPINSLPWRDHLLRGLLKPGETCSLPVLPVQLIEMAANLLLFLLLFFIGRRHPRPGLISALYMLLYAIVRFSTETLRGDDRMAVASLSIGQTISIALFACGVALYFISKGLKPADTSTNDAESA